MPAKSEEQRKAAGAALAAKRGDMDPDELYGAAKEMYNSMSADELEDYASSVKEGFEMKGKMLSEVNRMRELMGLERLDEAEMSYDEFFKQAADKFGIDPEAVDELPDEKKKEFFDYIDANWNSDSEFGEGGEVEEGYKDKKC